MLLSVTFEYACCAVCLLNNHVLNNHFRCRGKYPLHEYNCINILFFISGWKYEFFFIKRFKTIAPFQSSFLREIKDQYVPYRIYSIYSHIADSEMWSAVTRVTNLFYIKRIRDQNWVSCGLNASRSTMIAIHLVSSAVWRACFGPTETPLLLSSFRSVCKFEAHYGAVDVEQRYACGSHVNFRYVV